MPNLNARRSRAAGLLYPCLLLGAMLSMTGLHAQADDNLEAFLVAQVQEAQPRPVIRATRPEDPNAQPVKTPIPPDKIPQPPTPETTAFKPKGIALFFLGNRNSEIEPCGCVKNQLGGIQYEGTIYGNTPRESCIHVDVGSWTSQTIQKEAELETFFMLVAMGQGLDMDAVNVTTIDSGLGKEFFDKLKQEHPEAFERLVSANIYDAANPKQRVFAPYRLVERKTVDGKAVKCAIIGVTSPEKNFRPARRPAMGEPPIDYVIKEPMDELPGLIEEIKGKGAELIVVMAFGFWQEMEAIAQHHAEIDVILSSVRVPDYQKQYETVNGVLVFGQYSQLGKQIHRADLVPGEEGAWQLASGPETLNVSPKTIEPNQDLVKIVEDYKKATEDLKVIKPDNVKAVFAGSNSCAGCHTTEFKTWMDTQHSHALQTLVKKGSQYDAQCLQCHTLGFKQDNGFYNVKDTPQMGNVQCENCHGPALEHVRHENMIKSKATEAMATKQREAYLAAAKAAIPPKDVPEATCIKCHFGENDPHFNYEEKIHKVSHKDITTAGAQEVKPYPPKQ